MLLRHPLAGWGGVSDKRFSIDAGEGLRRPSGGIAMAANADSERVRGLLAKGELAEAGNLLKQQIRSRPDDSQLRIVYFQWLALNWEWDKARTQLDLIAELDAEAQLFASAYRPVVAAEQERAAVLAGKTTPILFGEPDERLAQRVEALRLLASHPDEGARLLESLEGELPDCACVVNGQPCPWVADGDSRFGDNLEGVVNGRYIWIPIERIAELSVTEPATGCDLIWAPTEFTWRNGGVTHGFLFVRYPGTEQAKDAALHLSRRTEWVAIGETELFHGLGQRMLLTEDREFPILDLRNLSLV
jgi:type VI secretion system protein ImpE